MCSVDCDCRLCSMEKEERNFIGIVNHIGRSCMIHRDYGGENKKHSLFDALPIVAVIGDQGSGKSSLLESIAGIEFFPKRSGFVTRIPLVLHLIKDYLYENMLLEFSHMPQRLFSYDDLSKVRQEIENETNRNAKRISPSPLHLFIYSPHVITNLTLIDLPTLTNAKGVEEMVKTYINNPNCIMLAVSTAGQDLEKSDAIKLAREVDPSGGRTIGVLTKLHLMDKGTHALDVLEGRTYPLDVPWVGVALDTMMMMFSIKRWVLNKFNLTDEGIHALDVLEEWTYDTDMMRMYTMRRWEQEYFATNPHYAHLANRMGTKYLAKLLSQRLASLIKAINVDSLIKRKIHELEADPKHDQSMLLLYKTARY